MKVKALFLVFLVLSVQFVIHAQTDSSVVLNPEDLWQKLRCSESPEYPNANKKLKKILKVSAIKGVTILYAAEYLAPDPKGFFEGSCVALFTDDKEHKLVATTISGNNGIFSLKNIPNGNYRLLITHPWGFTHPADLPIRLVKSKSNSGKKKIMVYMVGSNFAGDSYAKLK